MNITDDARKTSVSIYRTGTNVRPTTG